MDTLQPRRQLITDRAVTRVVSRDSPRARASRSPSVSSQQCHRCRLVAVLYLTLRMWSDHRCRITQPRRQVVTDRAMARAVAPTSSADLLPCIGLETDDVVSFLASWKVPRSTTAGPGGTHKTFIFQNNRLTLLRKNAHCVNTACGAATWVW
jgi:hypothetical protein